MQKKYHTLTNMHTNKSYESKYKIDRLRNVNKVNRDLMRIFFRKCRRIAKFWLLL